MVGECVCVCVCVCVREIVCVCTQVHTLVLSGWRGRGAYILSWSVYADLEMCSD